MMKKFAVALMFLVSQFALAGNRTATDIVVLLQNEEVASYLDSNPFNVLNSIEYVGSSRCLGPALYDIHLSIITPDGYKKCTKRVVVGECGNTEVRTQVNLSKELYCE
jgi:hypothetical protein